MSDYLQELISHYTMGYGEQNRFCLDRAHTIEYVTSLHFLKKHLPANCSVLDCCAGGGAYCFPLADAGYKVTAGDLIKEHVDILNAHEKRGLLTDVYQGDALSMPQFADGTFDAVLCMGALYHLHEKVAREACVRECLRVLKSGGIFVFAYINRNAIYINHFFNNMGDVNSRKTVLDTGKNGVFYGMDLNEPDELSKNFPLQKITDIGVDGLIYPLRDRLNSVSDGEFEAYMEYHLATCEQPSIIGHSMHGLWIGRKP